MPRILVEGLKFPEGPRWIGDRLWFVDMHDHKVKTVGIDGRAETVVDYPDKPSGMGVLGDGTVLCVSMRRRVIERIGPNGVRVAYADLNDITGDWLNDMVVGGRDQAYVGNLFSRDRPGEEVGPTALMGNVVLVEPDGSHRVVAEDLVAPNGSVITDDGETLIVAEALGHRLTAFDVEPDGSLANRRIFAETGDWNPDGICLDAEGAIWFGSPLDQVFVRMFEGGKVADTIEVMDGKWATACMLGGPDRRSLFLTTARTTRENMVAASDFESDLQSTAEGWIEVVEVDVAGAGWP